VIDILRCIGLNVELKWLWKKRCYWFHIHSRHVNDVIIAVVSPITRRSFLRLVQLNISFGHWNSHGSLGHELWPMIHPTSLTYLTHDPLSSLEYAFEAQRAQYKNLHIVDLLHQIQPNYVQWQTSVNTLRGWSKHAYNKCKMGDGRHCEKKSKSRHISATAWLICMKFGTVTHHTNHIGS